MKKEDTLEYQLNQLRSEYIKLMTELSKPIIYILDKITVTIIAIRRKTKL